MHDLHYNYIKKKYGNKAKLLFTNKDSLACEIETNKSFEYFRKDKDKFDFSKYPKNIQIFIVK